MENDLLTHSRTNVCTKRCVLCTFKRLFVRAQQYTRSSQLLPLAYASFHCNKKPLPLFTATKNQQLPHPLDTILPRSRLCTSSFSLDLFCHTLSAPITLILGGSISLTVSVPICLNLSLNLSISVSSLSLPQHNRINRAC